MEHIGSLVFHIIGVGLLVTAMVGGFIVDMQYRNAADLKTKAVLLRAMKPIGLMGPLASLILLVSGIGNMHSLGFGIFTVGWLTAKLFFYTLAVISGVIFGIMARRRGMLVGQMATDNAPTNADEILKKADRQIALSHLVMPLLFLIIITLAIAGRLGAQ